jgi:hypothetical protein
MRGINRLRAVIACAIVAIVAIAINAISAGASSRGTKTSGTFYVAVTPQFKNGIEYVAGGGTDKLLGSIAETFTIKPLASTKPSTVIAKAIKVTLWTSTGTLTGTGSATLTITGMPKAGDATVSGGKVSLTSGTGAQKGHSFVGTFTGTGNAVSGDYTFNYKGTYK